ncbi:alpha/beta-hydrolase family protein [Gordonia hydrophobica]|uniref:Alpha/beta-hydrolase family protein n=1 Tax=Gordonia hydrophobica TaxID=40516 RepID=A0ABZ2U4K5_9ACTN|nr:alpha/beta-hydrolase family protein [Gordonia hydrophobica]MBM7366852.1 putative membrane protein [Gordonia hydrophobica]
MTAAAVFRIRPAVAIGALVGRLLALAPGAMPRSMLVATAAGVLLTLVGMGVGALVGAVLDSRRDRVRRHRAQPVSGTVLAAGLLAVGVALGIAVRHEVEIRAATGAAPIGVGWVVTVTAVPLLAAVAAVIVRPRTWAALGLAGVIAVTALQVPGPAAAAPPDVPAGPAMLYSPLTEPGSVASRADRLVQRWVDDGGLDQRAVVIAVPTGSGWVDAGAVEGVQRHFADSVRVLGLQYDDVASWKAFVSSPDAAGNSASALLGAVDRRLAAVPPQQRPHVYLIGQSLGAVGADAARRWAAENGVHLDGTVLAGPPASSIEPLPACAPRVVLANRDDPVTAFSTALLWRPNDDRQRAGTPPWLPVVSLIGTALDLPGALDVPTGHGHRYGVEQGLAIGRLPGGCPTAG